MRSVVLAIAGLAALTAGDAVQARAKLTPEQQLAKLLEGREAGKPTTCLPHWQANDMRVIDGLAIVYGTGNTIWVNRPDNARDLDSDDILVTQSFDGRLCKVDIVHTVDRTGQFATGFISLGDFVPYRRVAKAG